MYIHTCTTSHAHPPPPLHTHRATHTHTQKQRSIQWSSKSYKPAADMGVRVDQFTLLLLCYLFPYICHVLEHFFFSLGDSQKASSFSLCFITRFCVTTGSSCPTGLEFTEVPEKPSKLTGKAPFGFASVHFLVSRSRSVFLSPPPAAGVILSAQWRPLLLSLCIHYRVTLTGFTGKPGESACESQSFVSLCRKLLFV